MEHFIAFWNVENLFDHKDAPRSDKLKRVLGRELAGWSVARRDRKIAQLASIIRQLNRGEGPDILGVCEVENARVLQLLMKALQPLNRNYGLAHHDTSDGRGIDVAFIYDQNRYTAREQFAHFIQKRRATRDLLQVNFESAAGNKLILIGNHWPARMPGTYQSAPYRMMAGETLAYFHERIRAIHGRDTAILALGDFNDDPFSRSLTEYALSERQRMKVTRARGARWLSAMWAFTSGNEGTFFYNNRAFLFDQFLLSRGLLTGKSGFSLVPGSVRIERFPEMVVGQYKKPRRFGRGRKTDRDGFSDHFPVSLCLKEKGRLSHG